MKAVFAHTQTYSRKGNGKSRSIAEICDEAARRAGAIPHVKNPTAPRIVEGMNPVRLPALIEDRVREQNRILRALRKEMPDRAGSLRGIRADTHLLVASVYSYPDAVGEYDPEEYGRWLADVIRFAKEDARSNGLEIKSITEHLDEPYPHVHIHALPIIDEDNPRMNAKRCHVGHIAQNQHVENGASGSPSRAYKQAMRAWQDRYHEMVGQKHGQARFGPKRRRLSRSGWQAEQRRLAVLKEAAMAERGLQKFADQAEAMANDLAKREHAVAKDEAALDEATPQARQEAKAILERALEQEQAILADARQKVQKKRDAEQGELTERRRVLEARSQALARDREALAAEAADIRQNAAREAVQVAVEIVAAVFTGDAGVDRNGKVFVRQPDLRDRVNAMKIGLIVKDTIRVIGDFWDGLKGRLSGEQVEAERARAQEVVTRTTTRDSGGPGMGF